MHGVCLSWSLILEQNRFQQEKDTLGSKTGDKVHFLFGLVVGGTPMIILETLNLLFKNCSVTLTESPAAIPEFEFFSVLEILLFLSKVKV